jgi:hypothetical protein
MKNALARNVVAGMLATRTQYVRTGDVIACIDGGIFHGVSRPNESSSPTAGGGSGGAQPKGTNEK